MFTAAWEKSLALLVPEERPAPVFSEAKLKARYAYGRLILFTRHAHARAQTRCFARNQSVSVRKLLQCLDQAYRIPSNGDAWFLSPLCAYDLDQRYAPMILISTRLRRPPSNSP